VEPHEYDEMLRTLVRIAAHQETINADLRESIRQQADMNRDFKAMLQQQAEFNQDVKTTLARLETLLARMWRPEDNGQDA
jgi:glutaminase